MDLSFSLNDKGLYEALATGITSCFNVHLESEKAGSASVYMRTSGTAYAKCTDEIRILLSDTDGVFCGEGEEMGLVFSKDVKIISNVPITYGCLTIES